MAQFPSSLPVFNDFNPAHTLAQDNHAARHNAVHAETAAIAARVGVTGSTDPTTHEKKIADLISGLATANSNISDNTTNIATNTAAIAANAAAITSNFAASVKIADTNASGYGFVLDEDDMASNSATKLPTQQSVKAYVDAGNELFTQLYGVINTAHPGGYVIRALSTPCTVTVPVVAGSKYMVTASTTYINNSAATGELDFGPGVGLASIIGGGTYGAMTGTYNMPVMTRGVYTATATGNVTFQVIVSSAAAVTVRTDNPMISVRKIL